MKKIIVLCVAALSLPIAIAQEKITLTQAECRQMALAHSEDLQKADNAVMQAELDKDIAFAAYLPKLDATATGTYMFPDMDMMGAKLQMRGMYLAGISLTQPIYAGGQIRAGNRLSEIGKDCALENQRKPRMQVIADAANAYWTYIAVLWKVRMLESYKAQMDTLFRQTESGVSAGMATENDLLRITAKKSEIHYQLQKAENGANLCRLALCNVLGCDLDTSIEPTDTVIKVSLPAELDTDISMRPELRLLHKQVEAAEQQVKMSRAEVLPTIGLSAGYMYFGNIKMKSEVGGQSFTQKIEDGNALVSVLVNIPLFHWGEGTKKIKKARLDLQNAQLDLQKNTRLLSIEAQQSMQNVDDSYRLIETAKLGCEQAKENLRMMRDRYDSGMCSLTDLLDAQSQWSQSQSNMIEAQTQYKIHETEYLRVVGRLE